MCEDYKRLEEITKYWRRHCYKAEILITKAIDLLDEITAGDQLCEEDICKAELLIPALLDWKSKNNIKI